MDKAQIERLTQLTLLAQGKPTKRPAKEILKGERSAGAKYAPPVRTEAPAEAPNEQS